MFQFGQRRERSAYGSALRVDRQDPSGRHRVQSAFDRSLQTPYTEMEVPVGRYFLPMTVTVRNKTPLVVPPAVRRKAGLKSGDRLEFRVSGQVITILPKPPAQDDEYTAAERRAIDRGIAQSEKEYAAGKSYGPFETAAEAIASINANLRRRQAAAKKRT